MHTKVYKRMPWVLVLMLVALLLSTAPMAQAQPAAAVTGPSVGVVCTEKASPNPTFDLETITGYITLGDGNTMFMWGYTEVGQPFQHPSPVLCVNEGDTVTVD